MEFLYTPHPFAPVVNMLHSCDTCVPNKDPTLTHYYELNSTFYLDFASFPLKPSFCPSFPPHITFVHHLSFSSSALLLSQSFLVVHDLDGFEEYVVYIDLLLLGPSNVSLMVRLRLWVLGKNITDEVPFSSCHMWGTCYQHDLSLMMSSLTTWPR